ncbi:DUF2637 domain-containing protein [Actinomadura sp. 3N407]|uniref:DUF2637 domain-containing protein n=1 Tax=Actinomadura sp. 3N407 TaxID=3457423 RepID=UPI003FCDCDA1
MNAGDRVIRITTAASVLGVGAIAGLVSYRHALEVVRAHGETGLTALLVPLTVDGLVVVASMVLLDSARRREDAPPLARWALGMGIGATVAVNVLHGVEHGPVGATIAAWPAVTLVVVVELLMTMIRRGGGAAADPPIKTDSRDVIMDGPTTPAPVVDAPAGVDQAAEDDPPDDAESTTPAEDDHAGHAPSEGLAGAVRSARVAGRSQRWISDEFKISRHQVRKLLDEPVPTGPAALNGHAPDG